MVRNDTASSNRSVAVNYATVNGTALAGSDYTATSGTLTFGPGETVKTFTVPVANDTAVEGDEAFTVVLSNPTNGASLGTPGTVTVTVVDDDRAPAATPTTTPTPTATPTATATPTPTPTVAPIVRVAPTSVSLRVTPTRDRRAPFRFRSTGTVTRPSGVPAAACTGGVVAVTIKAANKTISNKRITLTSSCSYTSTTSFRNRGRFTRSGGLRISARFAGTARLLPKSAPSRTVRTR